MGHWVVKGLYETHNMRKNGLYDMRMQLIELRSINQLPSMACDLHILRAMSLEYSGTFLKTKNQ